MSIMTVSLLEKKFSVACNGVGEEKLLRLAYDLESRMKKIRGNKELIPLEYVLVVTALHMCNQIDILNKKHHDLLIKNSSLEEEIEDFRLNLVELSSRLERKLDKVLSKN